MNQAGFCLNRLFNGCPFGLPHDTNKTKHSDGIILCGSRRYFMYMIEKSHIDRFYAGDFPADDALRPDINSMYQLVEIDWSR